jgi:DNA processing protein
VSSACPRCSRRAWLLAELGTPLDFRVRDLDRFWSLLELSDRDLIEAIGGRRRDELRGAYEAWAPIRDERIHGGVESVCRHHPCYPAILSKDALAPHMLSVRGELTRLADMLHAKVVAIVGTRRATDYGMELARELARGLATAGLTVAGGLGEGIARAVQTGVLEAHAKPLCVIAGGVTDCSPAWCRPLYRRIVEQGCAVSELQVSENARTRTWWGPASGRTLALLAQMTIVVEAGEHPRELACAHVARARGREVAAVPGRVSSPASQGTNALLMEGANLVRNTQDALDVLYGLSPHPPSNPSLCSGALEPRLASVLERVGRGQDTVAKLAGNRMLSGELALALAELELGGLLTRGDGGRYLPTARGLPARGLPR